MGTFRAAADRQRAITTFANCPTKLARRDVSQLTHFESQTLKITASRLPSSLHHQPFAPPSQTEPHGLGDILGPMLFPKPLLGRIPNFGFVSQNFGNKCTPAHKNTPDARFCPRSGIVDSRPDGENEERPLNSHGTGGF
jgi:hypothetical protein